MYNIIIFDSAHKDINDVYSFCNNISTSYAIKIKHKIAESVDALKFFPFSTPIYFIIQNKVFRKKIVLNRYLIIFSITKNDIIIYNIFDGRRNIKPTDLFK